ncbi:MAG: hypothetical protein IJX65_05355 [Alistipes sp.]|nr:hypothetical protein [Alistipes sp.]
MKKIFAIVALAIFAMPFELSAQKKGDFYLGGMVGVGVNSTIFEGESATAANFSIAPEFGYFVGNNIKIGASIGYGFSDDTHSLTIYPNAAYYLRLCEGMYYTPGIELGFAMGATEDITLPGIGLGVHLLSLEFRPTKHFGFTANLLSLNYVALFETVENPLASLDPDAKKSTTYTSHGVNFTFGLNPTVGVKFYF